MSQNKTRPAYQTPKPKLCKVCSRSSFLKCLDCEVIYCSAKCQVEDWETHQYEHVRNSNRQVQNNDGNRYYFKSVKTESVQGRLKKAVDQAPKVDTKEQIKNLDEKINKPDQPSCSKTLPIVPARTRISPTTVNIVSANLSSVKISDNVCPMSESSCITSLSNRKMMIAPKYTRHVKLSESLNDSEGFHLVCITAVEELNEMVTFWVMPSEVLGEHETYKEELNNTYNFDGKALVSADEIPKLKQRLVMAKKSGNWSRALITHYVEPGIVGIQDIDTGAQDIINIPGDQVKLPEEPELMKSAFAIKVMFENLEDAGEISVDDCVKIRMTNWGCYGQNLAEVKLSPDEDMEIEPTVPKTEANCGIQRYFFDQIQVQSLRKGDNIKLLFCDGSKIESGKLHVTESVKENWKFYDSLSVEIANYIKNHPSVGNYKPVAFELVLAKFTDNSYYRAVCKNVSDIDAKVHFIDYGSDNVCGFKELIKMPAQFLYDCCSHTVDFKLASGRDLKDINGDDTRELLVQKNDFHAKVESLAADASKYLITLDDSLFVFK